MNRINEKGVPTLRLDLVKADSNNAAPSLNSQRQSWSRISGSFIDLLAGGSKIMSSGGKLTGRRERDSEIDHQI